MKDENLDRFISAQSRSYDNALLEIKAGRKKSHWMWYIFPQIKGLGKSSTAQYYAIQDLEEANAYLIHPILGKRLRFISEELLALKENDPYKVFGSPDDMKLKSCMTLFAHLNHSNDNVFKKVLDKYYGGALDEKTLQIIEKKDF